MQQGGIKLRVVSLVIVALALALPSTAGAFFSGVQNGELFVLNETGGEIRVHCVELPPSQGGGKTLRINNIYPESGPIGCNQIKRIEVKDTGSNPDIFSMTEVDEEDFEQLTAIVLDGGGGADMLVGSELADTIRGGAGADQIVGDLGPDTVSAGEGDDRISWDHFDGNDRIDGDGGRDTVEVNGSAGSEEFTVGIVAGGRLAIRREPVWLDLDTGTVEVVDLEANGGDDSLRVPGFAGELPGLVFKVDGGPGADYLNTGSGADVLLGGDGEDILDGKAGADTLQGGTGRDSLTGGPSSPDPDVISGGIGDDTVFWRPGDGSDRVNGDAGTDLLETAGADVGEEFTLGQAAGQGVTLARTSPTPFSLEVNTTEGLRLLAGGGDDGIDAGAQGSLAGRIALELSGGAGDDRITGSDGVDLLQGGAGGDRINSADTVADTVNCGSERDAIAADSLDLVAEDCERGGDPPPPPDPPKPPQPAADTKAPVITVAKRKLTIKKGVVQVRLGCPADEVSCSVTTELRRGKAVFGRGKTTMAGGQKRTVKLRLASKALLTLKGAPRTKLKLVLRAQDAAGNAARQTVSAVLLHAPRVQAP